MTERSDCILIYCWK